MRAIYETDNVKTEGVQKYWANTIVFYIFALVLQFFDALYQVDTRKE